VPLMDVALLPFASCRTLLLASSSCSSLASLLHASFRPHSRLGPCASLSLHLHLVVKRTCTSKLSIMLGTQNEEGVPAGSVALFLFQNLLVLLFSALRSLCLCVENSFYFVNRTESRMEENVLS